MLFAAEIRRAINTSPNRLLDISLSTIGEHILPIGPFGSYQYQSSHALEERLRCVN